MALPEEIAGWARQVLETGWLSPLDPTNVTNLALYYLSIVVVVWTFVGLVLARRWWTRLPLLVANQLFSFGFLTSKIVVVIITWSQWQWALGVAGVTLIAAMTFYLWPARSGEAERPRKPAKEETDADDLLDGL